MNRQMRKDLTLEFSAEIRRRLECFVKEKETEHATNADLMRGLVMAAFRAVAKESVKEMAEQPVEMDGGKVGG